MKLRIGVVFGGFSREREISFAGGRTVYDNLDKSLFEAIPLFVDSFGNFVQLDWQFIYKGSIRDFYPPVQFLPKQKGEFSVYAESLQIDAREAQLELLREIGNPVELSALPQLIDFAFLALHGPYGEDGKIQGLLDYLKIPYSGSGIFPSSVGIDKALQKKLMVANGFNSPAFFEVKREHWLNDPHKVYENAKSQIDFPLVIKSASQGSSIGISILKNEVSFNEFKEALNKSFFIREISSSNWNEKSQIQKEAYVRELTDIREGIGNPVLFDDKIIFHPFDLLHAIDKAAKSSEKIVLKALDDESTVLIEGFIKGKEFSCIVIENELGKPLALPPTEIRKGAELFDYRSKYLPGLSRKITPIDLPDELINNIRNECERLYTALNFDVYARIDGFITEKNEVFLNDPNTTSGMMPSSFFFHQAAEIGLNPSQFLTYIIRASLNNRINNQGNRVKVDLIRKKFENALAGSRNAASDKIKVAVILGGYSSERHISVESGRNIFEKLSSSEKYSPIPVFLTGDDHNHELYIIPVNVLLKDNADDIKEKVNSYKIHPVVKSIIQKASEISGLFGPSVNLEPPKRISFDELAQMVDVAFIALHGRPGEDGALQQKLEQYNIPYNGSGVASSQITIDKYETTEILKSNGFSVAAHRLVSFNDWKESGDRIIDEIEKSFIYPFIAKPFDDGCSSAVKKIKSRDELIAFCNIIFRKQEVIPEKDASVLHIKPKEEFPVKNEFLIEELISAGNAKHFLEVTGGLLTHFNDKGEIEYEVFEASEALAEGEVLSLEEKFLAGQGQNITPARYSPDPVTRQAISDKVKKELERAAKVLNVQGYARIDAFVRVFDETDCEVIFIEVNSLPGMTPATCIFHQTAINGYKPYNFIDNILEFGFQRNKKTITA